LLLLLLLLPLLLLLLLLSQFFLLLLLPRIKLVMLVTLRSSRQNGHFQKTRLSTDLNKNRQVHIRGHKILS
jgi:hypothetical protein